MSRIEADHPGVLMAVAAGNKPAVPADPTQIRMFERAKVTPADDISAVEEERIRKPTVQASPKRPDKASVQALAAQLLERFGAGGTSTEQDRKILRSLIKESAPSGKQQELLLFDLLAVIKGKPGNGYCTALMNSELRWLIPRNAIVYNMLSNGHKLELES